MIILLLNLKQLSLLASFDNSDTSVDPLEVCVDTEYSEAGVGGVDGVCCNLLIGEDDAGVVVAFSALDA